MEVRLDQFKHQNHINKSKITLAFWLLLSSVFIQSKLPFPMFFKKIILQLFGAKIGSSFIIKSGVSIKYPWKLRVGNNVWVGENVWIDNLEQVEFGSLSKTLLKHAKLHSVPGNDAISYLCLSQLWDIFGDEVCRVCETPRCGCIGAPTCSTAHPHR